MCAGRRNRRCGGPRRPWRELRLRVNRRERARRTTLRHRPRAHALHRPLRGTSRVRARSKPAAPRCGARRRSPRARQHGRGAISGAITACSAISETVAPSSTSRSAISHLCPPAPTGLLLLESARVRAPSSRLDPVVETSLGNADRTTCLEVISDRITATRRSTGSMAASARSARSGRSW